MEDHMNEIDAYIRENRDRYTREALTRRLVSEGHEPAAIEAAWARIEADDAGGSPDVGGPPSRPAGRRGLGTTLLIILVTFAYGGAIAAAAANVFYGGAVSILMLAYVVAMLIGARYSLLRLIRAPTLVNGASAIGAAFALSFVIFVGLSGLCFVALGPAMNAGRGL
jgi:hypothetical protein